MSFTYQVYGLKIISNRQIKLLPEIALETQPELSIVWETNRQATPNTTLLWHKSETAQLTEETGIKIWESDDHNGVFTKVSFETKDSYFDFVLNPQKNKLWIFYSQELLDDDLDSYFVGQILGCVLRLCNNVCLHASVIEIDKKAIALLGHRNFGKSTNAAGFARAGFAVLSEDVAVIKSHNNAFFVHPGYPQIRLRPNSVEALFGSTKDLPKVYSFSEKECVTDKDGTQFSSKTLPLAAIYVLDRRETDLIPFTESISTPEKFIKLVENSYAGYAISNEQRRQEFFTLSALCQNVLIRKFVYGSNLTKLEMQIQTVVNDFREQTQKVKQASF